MKLILSLLFILVISMQSVAAKIPSYEAPRTSNKIVIDAVLNEEAWVKAPVITLKNRKINLPLKEPTKVKILWDKKSLYFAFLCQDKSLTASYKYHDMDIYKEYEVVELFLNQDGCPMSYFEFQVNPLNTRFDALIFGSTYPLGRSVLKAFNPKSFVSATSIQRHNGKITGWSVEMKIDWKDIGRPAKIGSRWRLNLFRLNSIDGQNEISDWSPCGKNAHNPATFGELILTNNVKGTTLLASRTWHGPNDTIMALCDGKIPPHTKTRFSWWPAKGSTEWVEYRFDKPRRISSAGIYWFDDSMRGGGCKIPQNAKISYLKNKKWYEINFKTAFPIVKNQLTKIEFSQVNADAIRLIVKLQSNFSGGLYEFKVK
jgi:Carbohydrate family 9 binding domain-like